MKSKTRIVLGIILLSLFVLTLSIQFAAAASEWTQIYGQSGDNEIYSVVQTSDGGYALGGFTNSSGAGGYDFWLVKTDVNGSIIWSQTYGGAGDDYAHSVIQTSDGGYALAGSTNSFGPGEINAYLVKTNANGNIVWNQTYGGRATNEAAAMIQTRDGGYAMAGYTDSYGAGGEDFWLIKTDQNGNMLWNKTYGGPGDDEASSVIQTSDGGYAIAGYTSSYGSALFSFWLVKTDSLGDPQWNQTYAYGAAGDNEASSVIQTSDGGYAVAGITNDTSSDTYYFWLVKTDQNGTTMWSQTYGDSTGDQFAQAVVQTGDGGYGLAGLTDSYGAGNFDFWLVKTDVSGNMQWNKTYGGSGDDEAYALIITSDGGFALAGLTSSFGAAIYDGWFVKTDASGNTVISQSSSSLPVSLQTIAIIAVVIIIIVLIAYLALGRGRRRANQNPSSSANPPAPTSPI
jgi:hypothetical protein